MVLELDIDIVADNKHIDSEHDIDNSKQHDDKSSAFDACARDNVESSVHNGHNNISLDIEWRQHLEQK
jgi:hypothetical protein